MGDWTFQQTLSSRLCAHLNPKIANCDRRSDQGKTDTRSDHKKSDSIVFSITVICQAISATLDDFTPTEASNTNDHWAPAALFDH
jgi:hypothetical protein